jgi:hypothetical protein
MSTQATLIFGIPRPCSIYPSCHSLSVGPNNVFSHAEYLTNVGIGSPAISFGKLSSQWSATGNYIFNWNSSTSGNTSDIGGFGSNIITNVLNSSNETRFPKANIEYYNASQQETGNQFSGYIDNGAGSAGYIMTVTLGSPAIDVPSFINGGYGDTIFDRTTNANVVAQYTRITAQIDATHYLVNVPQLVGSAASPVQMMYGSSYRFVVKAQSQSKETGWVYANSVAAANDNIRLNMKCGDQTTFPGSPACPTQGMTVH